MILVRDIRLPLSQGEEQAKARALSILRLPEHKVRQMGVSRLSVDARHGRPKLVYTIAVTLKDEGEEPAYAGASPCVAFRQETPFCLTPGPERLRSRPVVCGLGPAGLFAALALAQQGFAPLVLERGPALEERVRAVEHFSATGELDENANIQFGEGGAGTFSDGKLTTRIGDPLCGYVTQVFLAHGAPAEIAWQQKPHVGTDLLRGVIASIRREIEALGGEVRFRDRHFHHRRGHPLPDPGAGGGPFGAGHLRGPDGRWAGLQLQALQRGVPGRAPAKRDRKEPLPRGRRPPGPAPGGVSAFPSCKWARRLYVLYVPRRPGGGCGQRDGPGGHQRDELPRPGGQKRQRRRGGRGGARRFRERSPAGHCLPAGAGSPGLCRRAGRRPLRRPRRKHGQLSGRTGPAGHRPGSPPTTGAWRPPIWAACCLRN